MTSAENTATESGQRVDFGGFLTPHLAAMWVITTAAWASVIVVHARGESTTTGLTLGAAALTLTLMSVVTACYDGLRRAQDRNMARLLQHQQEVSERLNVTYCDALAALTTALDAQRGEVHRLRKNTKELGAEVHDTCELIEAQSLLIAETRTPGVYPVRRNQV